MKVKSFYFYFTVVMIAICALISVGILSNYLGAKQLTTTNLEIQTIKVEKVDYLSNITDLFDELNVVKQDDNQKVVKSVFKLAGSSLTDVAFTSNEDDANVNAQAITKIDEETNIGEVNLTLDYGNEYIDEVFATSDVVYENGEFVGTVTFDGVEYDVQEILNGQYGEDGVTECWFWFIIKIVIVIVNIVVAAITVVDIFKYFLTEEVTLEGVLCIVGEGLVMCATSAVGGAIAGSLIKSGAKILKAGKKASKQAQYLLGRKSADLMNESIKLVKQGKRNAGLKYSNDVDLRNAYARKTEFRKFKFDSRYKNDDDYIQIHHFVEQRQSGGKFNATDIHTDLNSVGIPKSLHQQISGFYSSKTKYLTDVEKIFGKNYFKGNTTFRDFVGAKSYEEQYEIGVKVFNYFNGKGNYANLRL